MGFDIACGVRTLHTGLKIADIESRKTEIADRLFRRIPAGVASTGRLKLTAAKLDEVLGVKLGTEATPIPNVSLLFALNINPEAAAQAYRDTSQFLFGKLASTAGQVVLAGVLNSTTIATPCLMGVIMNKPGANEEVEFAVQGIVKVMVATSTLIIADPIGINSTSKGTEVAETDNPAMIGYALEASSAANDINTAYLPGSPFRF